MQESYVRAFTRLSLLCGRSCPSTWLMRIVINEAYGRQRRRRATRSIDALPCLVLPARSRTHQGSARDCEALGWMDVKGAGPAEV